MEKNIFDPNIKLTRENIASLPPLVTDGAWGTEMQKQGAKPGELFDLWNIDAPEKVAKVAKSYVDAGSQIIITNTFSSNSVVLGNHGMAERSEELSKAGAQISKEAAAGKAYVFASIGPCGKLIMMGDITEEEVEEMARRQAGALEEGGADAIVIETQSNIEETRAALKGSLSAVSIPVGISFTFDSGKEFDHTMMGVDIAQAYALAVEMNASFVGANCGAGIETFVNIAEKYKQAGGNIPIWVKGNAGLPKVNDAGESYYDSPPESYADVVKPLLTAGASFMGGCCGSSPDHIRCMAEALKASL